MAFTGCEEHKRAAAMFEKLQWEHGPAKDPDFLIRTNSSRLFEHTALQGMVSRFVRSLTGADC